MKNTNSTAKQKSQPFWQRYFDRSFPGKSQIDESVPLWSVVRTEIANFGRGVGSSSKKLGERRDALLLGAGALYLLGYLTWALYGLINRIGFIAVLDVQYFAAGIFPALLIIALLIMIRFLGAVQAWMKYAPTRTQFTVAKGFAACTFVWSPLFVLFWCLGKPIWASLTALAGGLLTYSSQLLARNRGTRIMQQIMIWGIKGYAFFGLSLWLVYVAQLMPLVPTEWGGAKPRCILLDVDSKQLSAETRLWMVEKSDGDNNKGVVRTRALNLIFDGGEYFFLTEKAGMPSEMNPVYRLRKDTVKAVFPCPNNG